MWNFESFDKAREENLTLKQIEKQVRNKTKEDLKELKVDTEVTRSLHKGLKIIKNDTLFEINDITSSEHKINWLTEKKNGKWVWNADEIDIGDTIKILGTEVYKEPKGWGKKVLIGNVISGFEMKQAKPIPSKTEEAGNKETGTSKPGTLNNDIDKSVYDNTPDVKDGGNMSKIKNDFDRLEDAIGVKISDLGWKLDWKKEKITTITKKKIDRNPILGDDIDSEKYETTTYTIETTPNWRNIFWPNGEKVFLKKPELERNNLKWESLSKFNGLKEIVDIWSENALKVATNDAFFDTTQNNIKKSVTDIYKILNSTKNSAFANENDYQILIDSIFNIIIKTEDDERDIIDEGDMVKAKELLLLINNSNYETQILKIYNQMRGGLWISEDGDTSSVKENIALKLIEQRDFSFVKNITNKMWAVKWELTRWKIESIINEEPSLTIDPNATDKIKKNIIENTLKDFFKLESSYIWIDFTKWYHQFIQTHGLQTENFSQADYKNLIIKETFRKNAKHTILKSFFSDIPNRWDEDTTLHWMYADISWLSESKWIGDYFDIADPNINWTKEIWFTIATSLVPGGLAYAWARWAFTVWKLWALANSTNKWIKLGMATGNFVARNTAAYAASESYRSAKTWEWQWEWSWLGSFMAIDGIVWLVWKSFSKIKSTQWNKLTKTWAYWITILWWAEGAINIPRELQWREIVLNPADWTKDDLTLILMFAAMHGVGKFMVKKGPNWAINIKKSVKKWVDNFKTKNQSYVHKKTKTIYTKNAEGKFVDKKTGKVSRVRESSLDLVDNKLLKGLNAVWNLSGKGLSKTKELGKKGYQKATDATKKWFDSTLKWAKNLKAKVTKVKTKNTEKQAVKETMSDKEFDVFTKQNFVPKEKLNDIAEKIMSKKDLSPREKAIHIWKTTEIEKIIQKSFKKNNTKTPWKKDTKAENKTKNSEKWKAGKKEQTKKNSETVKAAQEKKAFESIKKSPELLKAIDSRLSSLPLGLNKAYSFSKWIKTKSWESITTPVRVVKDFKNAKGIEQHSKNIFFGDKDITLVKWAGKAWIYIGIPTWINEFIKLSDDDAHTIGFSPSETAKEIALNIPGLYLWAINTLIYQYLRSDALSSSKNTTNQ